ncbi:IS4/Tn5 family transposase DNA-binding protein [Microbulbifer okhotskensis]|uniref:IS4/Tn5 family transposase DNA-binding protein n=1 Tax=Microbulbifer okhotskensis TaxID=2926617 RepID=UPI00359C7EF4
MQDWVMDEVKNQAMGDTRLNKRLPNILSSLSSDPKNSIPCANKIWAETLAVYRFIENDKVNFDSIMTGHKSATLERIKAQPVVFIPQDTTFLNFATDLETTLRTVSCSYSPVVTVPFVNSGNLSKTLIQI